MSHRERQIPYNFTYKWNLKNKVNEQTKQKQTYRCREPTAGCYRGGVLGGWVVEVKGLRNINWQLQNSHGDVKYSIGNTVNNVITKCSVRWVRDLSGKSPHTLHKCLTTMLYARN